MSTLWSKFYNCQCRCLSADKILYRTISFFKKMYNRFWWLYCWFNLKKEVFLRKQYTPPSKLSKYYSKAPFSATASTLFLFILQFLKSLPVLSPVIYNFSFSTYLSYIHFLSFVHMPPVLFHISHEENYLSFLFLPHFSYWVKEKRRPPPFHPNKSKPFDHVVLF